MERVDLKLYCLVIEHNDRKVYLSLKNDEEVYGWQDDVYSRSPLMGVSNPTNFVHKVHVGFDPVTGAFTVSAAHPSPLVQLFDMLRVHRVCLSTGASCSPNLPSRAKTM